MPAEAGLSVWPRPMSIRPVAAMCVGIRCSVEVVVDLIVRHVHLARGGYARCGQAGQGMQCPVAGPAELVGRRLTVPIPLTVDGAGLGGSVSQLGHTSAHHGSRGWRGGSGEHLPGGQIGRRLRRCPDALRGFLQAIACACAVLVLEECQFKLTRLQETFHRLWATPRRTRTTIFSIYSCCCWRRLQPLVLLPGEVW